MLVVVAVGLFLLVGGLVSINRNSGPYHQDINRSFGEQARLLAEESNSVGVQLGALETHMVKDDRATLSEALDSVAQGSDSVASAASQLNSPAPEGHAGTDYVKAMTDRAVAVDRLRSTIDGLLQLTPEDPPASPLPPPPLSAPEAVTKLVGVGQLLSQADNDYRRARQEFSSVPGGFRLPASVWEPKTVLWGSGAVQTRVGQLTSSRALVPVKDVHLVAVNLTPPVLPPAPSVQGQPQAPPLGAGVSEVPPTCTLSVTAVVRNDGTIVAPKVPVEAAVEVVSGGPVYQVRKEVTLAPAGSVAVTLPEMPVSPGTTYHLVVAVVPPAGQTQSNGQQAATIAVASFASKTGQTRCARVPTAAP
jgi:hypothetical protein